MWPSTEEKPADATWVPFTSREFRPLDCRPCRNFLVPAELSMRLALVSTQLLLTQALRLAPGAKPRLATGGLTVLTPAAAHAASATYDFGYRLERALDPDKRGPSDDSAVSDIMASMCNPPMPAVDPAPALSHTDAAASGIASSTALAAQPAMATVPSAKVAACHNPSPHLAVTLAVA